MRNKLDIKSKGGDEVMTANKFDLQIVLNRELKKLIDLQKKMKELDDDGKQGPTNVTNAMFVGSTTDLQKMLKQQREINKKDKK